MIHPNCSELVVHLTDSYENLETILQEIMNITKTKLCGFYQCIFYSDIPLAEKQSRKTIVFPISLDDIKFFSVFGKPRYPYVSADSVPEEVRIKYPPSEIFIELGLTPDFRSIIKLEYDFTAGFHLEIWDCETELYDLIMKIALHLNRKIVDWSSTGDFTEWCEKHGYKSLIEIGWDDND